MDITLSKTHKFKNIDGWYCFINSKESGNVIIDFTATIAFDVSFNYQKPNCFVYLNQEIDLFNKDLKEKIISEVHQNKWYQNDFCLSEMYVDPHKVIQKKKKFIDVFKMKISPNCEFSGDLFKNTLVKFKVHVSGMWFSDNSFGAYLNVIEIEKINKPKKSLFLEDSDSDCEFLN